MAGDVIGVSTSPSAGRPVAALGESPYGSGPLWTRWWNLTLGDQPGNTVNLSQFHIQFSVDQGAFQSPWRMEATVINVPRQLALQITQQYTYVALAAGWQKVRRGVLFGGQVTYFEYGKLSPTETFLRIYAATADQATNQGFINQTLAAGYTSNDVVAAALKALAPYGVTAGYISPLLPNQSPRGRTLAGQPRDILRDLAQSENARAWIDGDKRLNVVKGGDTGYQPGVIQINQSNGLVMIPSQQPGQGITLRSLMNYQILPGMFVQLNQNDVNQVAGSSGGPNADISKQLDIGSIVPWSTGIFQVYTVRHTGDSRGNPWYTEVVTMPTNPEKVQMGVG
jgi:hypothetical protein